jgi:hypothetical protein
MINDNFDVTTMKVFLYQKVSTLNPKHYSLNNTFLQIDILQKNIRMEVLDNRYHHFDTSVNDIWCCSGEGIANKPFKVFYLQSLYHTTLKSILPSPNLNQRHEAICKTSLLRSHTNCHLLLEHP